MERGPLWATLDSLEAFQTEEESDLAEEAEGAMKAAFMKWLEEAAAEGPRQGCVKAVGSRQLGLRLRGSDLGNKI